MLPLREVTWKHPTSSVYITIPKLPLKFLPSSAALFKETDHPFRWFLAPYVYMYITSVDSAESYKAVKPVIKQWTELHSSKGYAHQYMNIHVTFLYIKYNLYFQLYFMQLKFTLYLEIIGSFCTPLSWELRRILYKRY